MDRAIPYIILFICLQLIPVGYLHAQGTTEDIQQAGRYLDSRTSSLDKYLDRSGKIQQRLLRKLRRKEHKMLAQLAAKDSALYRRYIQQGTGYDSITVLTQDTASLDRLSGKKNSLADSLKGVRRFIENQQGLLGKTAAMTDKAGLKLPDGQGLDQLGRQLNAQQKIGELIQQRTASLEGMARSHGLSGFTGIQKDVYYAKEKIKAWKTLADEPDDAEAEALEYLQGTEGFAPYLKQDNNAFGGLGNNATPEELERLGFQTKKQVNAMLQQQLGDNLAAVQQQMAQQVQQYTDKLDGITGKVKEVQGNIGAAQQALGEAKQLKNNIKNIEKTAFKKNPERGKPFWQRLETQYNFQTIRASTDGLRPAMMDLGASVAFKHSPKLSYGIGFGLSAGLGRDWQHIRLGYEGISARVYADWLWLYGFSVQAGYERVFRPSNRAYLPEETNNGPDRSESNNIFKQAFGGQQQSAYLGIMKRYRISSKWNGTLLAAYNFLWQQEGMRSPFMLRFGWSK